MHNYSVPVASIWSALHAAGLRDLLALDPFHFDESDVRGVLDGFAALATEVIAPSNRVGDRTGASLDRQSGTVSIDPSVAAAYRKYADGGWCGITAPLEFGGGGFPRLVGVALQEMFAAANMALSLNPTLSQSAIELLLRWGSPEQCSSYLPLLLSGEWSGTMDLTEPEAGSDLGAIRTIAIPTDDGRWSISGTKIFITWGEHDLTENIVHLVLARTPGAPAGTKGLSLFLVRKLLPGSGAGRVRRNAVRCESLERKVGIHSSPTCVLSFEGADGELVGQVGAGMTGMFTMMNAARLAMGVQGLAVSERSYQQSLAFTHERRQGRASGGKEPVLIAYHPDVQRMLANMASSIDAMRALLYHCAAASDYAQAALEVEQRRAAQARADLLTPLAKAWASDEGVRLTSLGIQLHGGMGYIEETGIAQLWRDSRIAPIYEGTNGIQAIDLISRKVVRDDGKALTALLDELGRKLSRPCNDRRLGPACSAVLDGLAEVRKCAAWIIDAAPAHMPDVLAGASPFLEMVATTVAAGLLVVSVNREWNNQPEIDGAIERACLFALQRVPQASALRSSVCAGSDQSVAASGVRW